MLINGERTVVVQFLQSNSYYQTILQWDNSYGNYAHTDMLSDVDRLPLNHSVGF